MTKYRPRPRQSAFYMYLYSPLFISSFVPTSKNNFFLSTAPVARFTRFHPLLGYNIVNGLPRILTSLYIYILDFLFNAYFILNILFNEKQVFSIDPHIKKPRWKSKTENARSAKQTSKFNQNKINKRKLILSYLKNRQNEMYLDFNISLSQNLLSFKIKFRI